MDEELRAFLTQQFEAFQRRLDERFETAERRLARTLDERFEDAKHLLGVLSEDLRSQVQTVAEGHLVLQRQIRELRDENEAAHRDIIGGVKLVYTEIDRRLSRLESRTHE